LLTYDEQVLWKLICENGYLWRGWFDQDGVYQWNTRTWFAEWERLKAHWEIFRAVAEGTSDVVELPDWERRGKPGRSTQKVQEDVHNAEFLKYEIERTENGLVAIRSAPEQLETPLGRARWEHWLQHQESTLWMLLTVAEAAKIPMEREEEYKEELQSWRAFYDQLVSNMSGWGIEPQRDDSSED